MSGFSHNALGPRVPGRSEGPLQKPDSGFDLRIETIAPMPRALHQAQLHGPRVWTPPHHIKQPPRLKGGYNGIGCPMNQQCGRQRRITWQAPQKTQRACRIGAGGAVLHSRTNQNILRGRSAGRDRIPGHTIGQAIALQSPEIRRRIPGHQGGQPGLRIPGQIKSRPKRKMRPRGLPPYRNTAAS